MKEIRIRQALLTDAEQILNVYAPYVERTAISFEYPVPTLEEFRGRIERTLRRFPYIVAERDGHIVGYAYAGYLNVRAAYEWSVETTIYLEKEIRGCGLGKRIYTALEDILKWMGIINLNACIAYPKTEDEYLTKNSAKFHEHMGYRMIGEFHQCGYKFGRWYNMIWMEKMLGEHPEKPEPIRLFPEITEEINYVDY